MERLKEFEDLHRLENQKKGRKKIDKPKPKAEQPFNPNESQQLLLNNDKNAL